MLRIRLSADSWGWFYLSTILDAYSRYVIAWRLCTAMKASGLTATLEDAPVASGCDRAAVAHRPRLLPRLLSDNGASYISGELADWLGDQGMDHARGAPRHPQTRGPQTRGKIERWHQTVKNRVRSRNCYLPVALEAAIGDFIDHSNHRRYHGSLGNLTPVDLCLGRAETILRRRKEIKATTIEKRHLLQRQTAA